jgi:hypothetical protein
MPTTRNLAILIFGDVEVLDFCRPFEVFSVANRFTDPPAFNVLTVAERAGPVVSSGGLSVNPHALLVDWPQPYVLLVPGGQGTRKEMHDPALLDWIRQASTKAGRTERGRKGVEGDGKRSGDGNGSGSHFRNVNSHREFLEPDKAKWVSQAEFSEKWTQLSSTYFK